MSTDRSYESYKAMMERLEMTPMEYENWARLTHKLNRGENELTQQRDAWLRSEQDSLKRREEEKQRRNQLRANG